LPTDAFKCILKGGKIKTTGLGYKHTMKTKLPLNAYEKPTLIIISHIKNFIKEKGYRTNSLTPRAVNDAVIEIIEKAIRRTKLDKKKTIFPKHI